MVEIGEVYVNGSQHACDLHFHSMELFRSLVGTLGQNTKIIRRVFGVETRQGSDKLSLQGDREILLSAKNAIMQLISMIASGHSLYPAEVDQICRLLKTEPDTNVLNLVKQAIFVGKSKRIYPRSIRQKRYFEAIQKNDVVFGVGPAGTGKTYLAMAMALACLQREEVRRIILCRPAVEAGEKLGFLPGDMLEKVNPYLRPLYDALFDLIGQEKGTRYIEREIVEVAPLAFMRGRTLSNAFVILDEAQNTTPEQMKMFLTRVGLGSKVVVTGDPSQVDLPRMQKSGLKQALNILRGVEGIEVAELTDVDVVRHPVVSAIIKAYARAGRSDG